MLCRVSFATQSCIPLSTGLSGAWLFGGFRLRCFMKSPQMRFRSWPFSIRVAIPKCGSREWDSYVLSCDKIPRPAFSFINNHTTQQFITQLSK